MNRCKRKILIQLGLTGILLLVLQLTLLQSARAEGDPYAPYLNSIPAVIKSIAEINSGSGDSAITTKRFTFGSRNNINTVYAITAYPQKQGVYPALLILHGGGSKAEDVAYLVEAYARRGYVALAFDMPGICNNSTVPNSSGPWKLRTGPLEIPRFDIAKGLQNSTLVDAEVAGIEAFNYVSSQKNVDVKNIGITGFSWGGYSTTMLAGILGKRVKAAYSVFGCGYYEKGSFWKKMIADLPDSVRTPWLQYFDAGRRAPSIKAPYFLEATSNDTYFWPESVKWTLAAIHGTKNHVWDTNFNHKQQPAGPKMQQLYFDYYLKGKGQPFGTAKIIHEQVLADSSKRITILTYIPKGVAVSSVVLYCSESNVKWQSRDWVPITAQSESDNSYTVTIPAVLVKKGVDYYAYVTDERTVSVASDMYNALYSLKNQPNKQ
jgi:dienelactone hydrolase